MIGLAILAAGLLAFGCCAGLLLAWRARRTLGWEVPYRLSVLSHIGMAAIILIVALGIPAAAGSLRLLGEESGVALGLAVFLMLWRAGVAVLVQWFATRPTDTILIQFRLRRLERFAYLVTVSGVIVAGLLLALLNVVISLPGHADVARAASNAAERAALPVDTVTRGPDLRSVYVAEVTRTVRAWAAAWSRRDLDGYIDFYAPEFMPENGQSRALWETGRRKRVGAAQNINVRVESLKVTFTGAANDKVTVRMRQHYTSGTQVETTAKTLVMIRSGGGWKILKEVSYSKRP